MSYRIALTGAQGTGKSTLAQAICAGLGAIGIADVRPFLGLGPRVSRAGAPTGPGAGPDTVRQFVRAHLEREATATGAVQVFDRCLLDTLAYAKVLDCLPRNELRALALATVDSCRRSQQLIWLRVTQDYPVVNEIDEPPEFRRAIDTAIGLAARENRIAVLAYAFPPDVLSVVSGQILRRAARSLAQASAWPSAFTPSRNR